MMLMQATNRAAVSIDDLTALAIQDITDVSPVVIAAVATQPSGPELRITPAAFQFRQPLIVAGGALAAGLLAGILIGRWTK